MTVNCIYMPLLIATSKAADELSIAFATRGIEDLNLRSCLVNIQMRVEDWLALFLFVGLIPYYPGLLGNSIHVRDSLRQR